LGATSTPGSTLRINDRDYLWPKKPVVVVCQTGRRSAMATSILRKAGLTRVANVAGGMVRWRELGLPS